MTRSIPFLAALMAFGFSGAALAQQCIEPPVLTGATVCDVPTTGGTCNFGSSDGVVRFPNQTVTGSVTINGGRNVYVGPGKIRLESPARGAVTFKRPRDVFVEGLHVDANGYCDVFAVRNEGGVQTNFTFQNIYAKGPAYNVVDGNCHGDLIQNQQIFGGELNLTVENFVGVTSGQGFFIPRYGEAGPNDRTSLRNVHIRETVMTEHTYGLLWFWSPKYDPGHQEHPVSLDNVNVGWGGSWLPILPQTGAWTGDVYDYQHPEIEGVVNRWYPDGTDMGYPEHTGLNYDRSFFCANTDPTPVPDPIPDPEPIDTAGPLIEWVSPAVDVHAPSWQIAKVIASDESGVARVEIYIDNVMATACNTDECSSSFHIKGRPNTYILDAVATDIHGNISTAGITIVATK